MRLYKYILAVAFGAFLTAAGSVYAGEQVTIPKATSYGLIPIGQTSGNYTPTATSSTKFFTLTTTGSSGAATYSSGVLNIPQYSGGASSTLLGDTNTFTGTSTLATTTAFVLEVGTSTPNANAAFAVTGDSYLNGYLTLQNDDVSLSMHREDNAQAATADYIPAGIISPTNIWWSTGLLSDGNTNNWAINAFNGTSDAEYLTVRNNGNVGINALVPAYKLDVTGDVRVNGGDIRQNGSTVIRQVDSPLYLQTDTANDIIFRTSVVSEQMRIRDNGNVGIGTSTPGSLLSLNNIANFTTSTSTFYGSGGLKIASGCFSILDSCLSTSTLQSKTSVIIGTSTGADFVTTGTNDQIVASAAITYALANNIRTIHFKAGTYNFSSAVTKTLSGQNLTIEGEGLGTIIRNVAVSSSHANDIFNITCGGTVGPEFLTIKNLQIVGNSTGGMGIHVASCYQGTLENIRGRDFTAAAGWGVAIDLDFGIDFTIINPVLTGNSYSGLQLENNSNANTIVGGWLYSQLSGGAGARVISANKNTFNGTIFETNTDYGVIFSGSRYNQIKNCWVENNGIAGVYVDDLSSVIDSCWFTLNTLDIDVQGTAQDSIIENNRFNDGGKITLRSGTARPIIKDNVNLTTITDNGATGANVFNAGKYGIGTSSPYAALSVVGSSGVVADHYVATSTTAASTLPLILSSNGSASAPSYAFSNAANYGMYFNNASGVTFTANGSDIFGTRSGALNIVGGDVLTWTDSGVAGTQDTGLSRLSSGVVAVGTGANGSAAGTLLAAKIGVGTTSPFAALSVFAGGDYASHAASTLFAIGSTTAGTATSTLFSIDSNGSVSIGTSTPQAKFQISSLFGAIPANGMFFAIASSTLTATTTVFGVSSTGHIIASSTSVTVGTCGTSPTVQGDDTTGEVTVGTGAVGACTVTFAYIWSTAPHCFVGFNITAATSTLIFPSISTSGIVINSSSTKGTLTNQLGGSKIDYWCVQDR